VLRLRPPPVGARPEATARPPGTGALALRNRFQHRLDGSDRLWSTVVCQLVAASVQHQAEKQEGGSLVTVGKPVVAASHGVHERRCLSLDASVVAAVGPINPRIYGSFGSDAFQATAMVP
jgi:hypothetical protein